MQSTQDLLQAILDAMPAHIALLDQAGNIVAVNAGWRSVAAAYSITETACEIKSNFIDACASAVGSNEAKARSLAVGIIDVLAQKRQEFRLEYTCNHLDQQYWYIIRVKRFEAANSVRVLVSLEDITQSRQTEAVLRAIVEGTSAAVGQEFFRSLVFHLASALSVRYAFITECVEGATLAKVRTLAFWSENDFGENFDYVLANTPCKRVVGGTICHYSKEVQVLFPQDQDLVRFKAQSYIGVPLINSSGIAVGHLVVIDDKPMEDGSIGISIMKIVASRAAAELERQRMEARLVHDALHDTLTLLPNRSLFSDRLNWALNRVKRYPDFKFAVLFLDLDRFKVINDSLGHETGDQLLVALAERIKSCLRPSDTLARLGGDEFAILLENINDINDATLVAERIQQTLRSPFYLGLNEVYSSVSIGIALSATGLDSPEDLLRNADIAMYSAKAMGRTRYETFDAAMHIQAVTRLQLETDLRRSIDRGELRLFYQPIISLTTNQTVGFEALVRWQHPTRGLVSPEDFILLAEETGLIIPLGWWVLQEACYQLREWQTCFANPELTISVNLSNKQFSQLSLAESVVQILQATGLEPTSLRLEITESALLENAQAALDTFEELKDLGIQLHLDDFGTGYSSLSYLHRLPIDALKIDRSFVNRITKNGENAEIVGAIVVLARSLGMKTIAEGIETEVQLNQLRSLECTFGQGYWFSTPLEANAVLEWLTTRITA